MRTCIHVCVCVCVCACVCVCVCVCVSTEFMCAGWELAVAVSMCIRVCALYDKLSTEGLCVHRDRMLMHGIGVYNHTYVQ